MDMRQHALGQAREAFAESREKIFAAMEVINEILEYAKREGLIALAKDEFFRQKGEPHILDVIVLDGILNRAATAQSLRIKISI